MILRKAFCNFAENWVALNCLKYHISKNLLSKQASGYVLMLFLLFFTHLTEGQIPDANKLIAEEIKFTELSSASVSLPSKEVRPKAFDISQLEIKKNSFDNVSQYKAKELNRALFANNPFDLEDLSNPFNLSLKGTKRKSFKSKPKDPEFEKFFASLFEYKAQEKKSVINKKPSPVVPFWMFFTLLGTISLLSYMYVSFYGDIKKSFQTYSSFTSASQQLREAGNLTFYSILSNALFFLSAGQFLFLVNNIWNYENAAWSFSNLNIMMGGLIFVYLFKSVQFSITNLVFPVKQQVDYYKFNLLNGNRLSGLALAPLLFFVAYSPEPVRQFSIFLGITLIAANLSFSIFKTLISSWEMIVSNKFHFFLYLCAVELTPILILLKFLSII